LEIELRIRQLAPILVESVVCRPADIFLRVPAGHNCFWTGRGTLGAEMAASEKYVYEGHPTVEELMAEQGIVFPRDAQELLGDFWPEDEAVEDFLNAMHEWRGHTRTDPAA